MKEKLDIMEQY